MKYCARFILFLPLLGNRLLASALMCAVICAQANANSSDVFGEAVAKFEKKEYKDAYTMFKDLYDKKSDDPRVNFYLGLCAFELRKYDDAVLALERTLIMEPNHIRARLELAKTYFEQKDYQSAEAEFDEVLSNKTIPKEVADNIVIHKQIINAKKQKHYLNGYVSIGMGYDSNINNDIGLKDYTVPIFGGLSLSGDVPKEDYYHAETLGINHIYNLSSLTDGLSWQSNLLFYGQTYRHYIEHNIRYLGITSGPSYKNGAYELSMGLTADKLEFGGLDYMKSFGIAPKGTYFIDDTLAVNAGYALKKKIHHYDNKGKNSISQEVSVGAKKTIRQIGSALSLNLSATKETELINDQTDPSSRTDVSVFSKTIGVGLYQLLPYGFELSLDASIKKSAYAETNAIFLDREQDLTFYYNIGLYKSIFENSFLGLTANYSNNKSNFANRVYQKRGFGISYISNF